MGATQFKKASTCTAIKKIGWPSHCEMTRPVLSKKRDPVPTVGVDMAAAADSKSSRTLGDLQCQNLHGTNRASHCGLRPTHRNLQHEEYVGREAMKLNLTKSDWEVPNLAVDEFADFVHAAGYDGTEIYLPQRKESTARIRSVHKQRNLVLIGHIATDGADAASHLQSLDERYQRAIETEPLFINCHTGKDHFSFHDSMKIFEHGQELMERHGVPLIHETHRGRALFSLPATHAFLKELPNLQLTADFSHWVCVHESDLSDQPTSLELAMRRTAHIHARVGFNQGPQVSDPRNPQHRFWLDRFTKWWTQILELRRTEGRDWFTISPEFGPPPYMPLAGSQSEPVGDAWEINLWMRKYLNDKLRREVNA